MVYSLLWVMQDLHHQPYFPEDRLEALDLVERRTEEVAEKVQAGSGV